MSQQTFTDVEYANRRRKTRRGEFLEMMDGMIPWGEWCDLIRPYYYKGGMGRRPIAIETMLRMYMLQVWFSLSDEGVEDAIYDSYAMRRFMRIDFCDEQAPDATTLLRFRHLLERNGIGEKLLAYQVACLEGGGYMMRGGTIVDATLIDASPSTKNRSGGRDPEMHSVKKGTDWHFGMKCHAGVDAGTGLVHTVTGTAANVPDVQEAHRLIRGDDHSVYGDSGYRGIGKRPEIAGDERFADIDFRINRMRGKLRALPPIAKHWEMDIERRKSATRCKVEHFFHIMKDIFGFKKAVYKGIAKNLNRCQMIAVGANCYMLGVAGRRPGPILP
jgi:IS5 family transposase